MVHSPSERKRKIVASPPIGSRCGPRRQSRGPGHRVPRDLPQRKSVGEHRRKGQFGDASKLREAGRGTAALLEWNRVRKLQRQGAVMDPRYPIGNFAMPSGITPALRQAAIEDIASAPGKLRAAVAGLSDGPLENP